MSAAPASGDRRANSTTQTTTTRYDVERRPRRWLALLALVPLVAGVIETNERIEDDLEERALEAGAARADFTAQDGEICADDIDAVSERVRDITGVVKLDEADDCPAADTMADEAPAATTPPTTAAPEPTTPPTTEPPATTAPPTTTEPPPPADPDLVDTLTDDGAFGTLAALVGAAGLEETLRGDGPITVFAPSDGAFDALDPDVAARLEDEPDLLAAIIAAHAVSGELAAADLATGSLESLAGTALDITVDDGVSVVAGDGDPATVTRPDIAATNGVIHEIDIVLLPPSLLIAPSGLDASADYDGSTITLTGTVDTEAQRAALVDGALAAVDGDATRVVDDLEVAGTEQNDNVDAADDRVDAFADLLSAFPPNTASARGTVGDRVLLTAVFLDDDARAELEAAAAEAGVDAGDLGLEERPQATEADRDQLIDDVNALFVDRAIQFAPNSAQILPESEPLLNEAAAQLIQFDLTGIVINIEGHTDSDGDDEFNLELSQERAEAVEQALIDRGIDGDVLNPIGFGASQPIAPNDTDANKALNRRVTFSAQQ